MDKTWARFWKHVEVDPGGCWLWTAGAYSSGYGCFMVSSKPVRRTIGAHRWLYEQQVGPVPEGYQLDHLCRVRLCVNPSHLEAVTVSENARRREEARRNGLPSSGVPVVMGNHSRDKTHCPRGHSYSGENLYVPPSGARHCRTCMLENKRQRRAAIAADPERLAEQRRRDAVAAQESRTRKRGGKPANPNHLKTHCPQGHEYTPENTYVNCEGTRKCRACLRVRGRENMRQWRAKKFPDRALPPAERTHCPKGHEYSGVAGGQRVCKICRADASRRYKAKKRAAM